MASGGVDRYCGRPLLAAVALLNLITGAGAAWLLARLAAGADVDVLRSGADAILGRPATELLHPGSVGQFLYPPLTALLAVPLTLVPAAGAALVMSLIGAALLVAGIVRETRGRPAIDRVLVAVAVLSLVPVVIELLLGQVTVLIAASLYPLMRSDGRWRGLALGIALATVPKPPLLLVLAWMLVHRRQALPVTIATAAVLTLVGLVATGTGAYAGWVDALRTAGGVSRQGNVSLWAGGASPIAIIAAVLVVALFLVCVRREVAGFVAALAAGLLLAPYTLTYALTILVLVPVAGRGSWLRSAGARPLALLANLVCLAGLAGVLAGAVLVLAALAARPGPSAGTAPAAPAPV